MKTKAISATLLFMILTSVSPVLAEGLADTSTSRVRAEGVGPETPSDMNIRLNPQLGVSSFEYSGEGNGKSKAELSGGATFEFGQPSRKLETGILLLRTGGIYKLNNQDNTINNEYLGIPVLAKLRLMGERVQSWYLKLGTTPIFSIAHKGDVPTNKVDILGTAGLGGRFAFTRKSDFILEATYNRGLMDAISTSQQRASFNQGFLVMAGLSFNI